MGQNRIAEGARVVEAAAHDEGPYAPEQLAEHVADQAAIVGRVAVDLIARSAVRVAPTDATRAEVRGLVELAHRASASAQGHYHAARMAHGDEATARVGEVHVGDLTHDLPSVVRLCRVLEQYLSRPEIVADVAPDAPAALTAGGEAEGEGEGEGEGKGKRKRGGR